MKKSPLSLIFTAVLLLLSVQNIYSQVSDDQVVSYVMKARSEGVSQKEMAIHLQQMGVTREQAERIRNTYQNGSASGTTTPTSSFIADRSREEVVVPVVALPEEGNSNIFGHNIFSGGSLTFEPNMNIPTPENYRLGPGDEVIIDVWGVSQASIRQKITPEGNIMVDKLGPIYLSGKTINQANEYLQQEFSRIYPVMGDDAISQIKLTIGQIRSIQINIMGEVARPGTYTISSFGTAFHALYQAGGVSRIGTMRDIKVFRNGKEIASIDIYELILNGKIDKDITLQDNDLIIVNPYQNIVRISGEVKRPMLYEMKADETIETLIEYAGGFTGEALKENLSLVRKTERERQIYTINQENFGSFTLNDRDEISIKSNLDLFENRIEITGSVWRPGAYQLGDEVKTAKDLIKKAEGLRGEAFLNRAILYRRHDDLSYEIIPIDLNKLISGAIADIPLQKFDHLYVPNMYDMNDRGSFTIHGQVSRPGTYTYRENTTISDLIVQAGGLLESASTSKIDVTRRLKDPSATSVSDTIGQVFTFSVDGDFFISGDPDFVLEPYDYVFVRRSPGYYPQQNVTIVGEVAFPGTYTLLYKNQRISDLVDMAGGITPAAYLKGAYLFRSRENEEKLRQSAVNDIIRHQNERDSIDKSLVELSSRFSVGIQLDKALEDPESAYNFILQEGDQLIIPQYISTVKIQGTVMYPNTVIFHPDMKIKHYIEQAGGYAYRAKRNKVYIVYMNGTVAIAKKCKKGIVEPGCEIIVPAKHERKGVELSNIMGIATTSASITTMLVALLNLIK